MDKAIREAVRAACQEVGLRGLRMAFGGTQGAEAARAITKEPTP